MVASSSGYTDIHRGENHSKSAVVWLVGWQMSRHTYAVHLRFGEELAHGHNVWLDAVLAHIVHIVLEADGHHQRRAAVVDADDVSQQLELALQHVDSVVAARR